MCSNRSGALKTFFSQNKDIFLDDNDRFYTEFSNSNFYRNSQLDYKPVQKSLNNLYKSAADDNEREYIGKMRRLHRQLLCPYCLRSNCRTLDHYFDKVSYSELSLNIWNLVPTCGDCNFKNLVLVLPVLLKGLSILILMNFMIKMIAIFKINNH